MSLSEKIDYILAWLFRIFGLIMVVGAAFSGPDTTDTLIIGWIMYFGGWIVISILDSRND